VSSTIVTADTVVLTEQGQAWLRARLSDRLDELAEVAVRLGQHVEARVQSAAAVAVAADGDPPAVVADRERYAELVAEVNELTSALREAVPVAEVEEDPSVVELGDEVELELPDGTRGCWCIVHPLEAPMAADRISVASPLARAVFGRRPGDHATVVEDGGVYGVTIVSRRRLR
jgi:transcription elongation GreA/GreB family factor